jgi:hypothetical protein
VYQQRYGYVPQKPRFFLRWGSPFLSFKLSRVKKKTKFFAGKPLFKNGKLKRYRAFHHVRRLRRIKLRQVIKV